MIPTHVQIVGKNGTGNEVSYITHRDKVTLCQENVAALDTTVKPTTSYVAFIEGTGVTVVFMEYSHWVEASHKLRVTQ